MTTEIYDSQPSCQESDNDAHSLYLARTQLAYSRMRQDQNRQVSEDIGNTNIFIYSHQVATVTTAYRLVPVVCKWLTYGKCGNDASEDTMPYHDSHDRPGGNANFAIHEDPEVEDQDRDFRECDRGHIQQSG
ncbi:hypothetical protein DPV78_010764 [Talaromyces pinophilus]|nr:hypothetical protein DPV78_010764 [Talaromyces pinophilus]